MNRLDRALGILLFLRNGSTVSASELARRFEVSPRTIYRDVETLSAIGVPVYAEMGRTGGFRLTEGYFLPPIMFSRGEAAALLVGIAMLRRLRATPFAADLETAARKVVAALPESIRDAITRAEHAIGFEEIPADLLHPERGERPEMLAKHQAAVAQEADILGSFLQAIVELRTVKLIYQSPGDRAPREIAAAPYGLVWDRDRWYLVGARPERPADYRLWRADRVASLTIDAPLPAGWSPYEIRAILDRRWLDAAMEQWIHEAPVTLSLTRRQAAYLQSDWYYRHARFAQLPDGRVSMSFGEDDRSVVFALLRWLGPGARLVEPRHWRDAWRDELRAMWEEAGDE